MATGSPFITADATRPAQKAVACTFDTQYPTARALWVSVTGNISVVFPDGTSYTFPNVPVGWFSVQSIAVNSVGTTVAAASLGVVY